MLGELFWSCLHKLTAEPLWKVDAFALNVGAGVFPHLQRFRVVAEINADLFLHGVRVGLDQRKAFF